jgi:16S rRNA (adenine1518-N6/adenine1519-N6)-dimethyltransferase
MTALPSYDSPAKLKELLAFQGLAMHKRFGQNFLINPAAREKIARALEITPGMAVWEIGPGLGALSSLLLEKGAILRGFEIDRGFLALLETFFEPEIAQGRFALVPGDALKTWKPALDKWGVPQRFCGNLPYNIAATLIGGTIQGGIRFERAVFTLQKEMALRMATLPGTKQYSAFSALCRWAYTTTLLFDLAPGNFWPPPEVDSTVVLLQPRTDFPGCDNPAVFPWIVHAAFGSRRKTKKNNLASFFGGAAQAETALLRAEINPSSRAEELDAPQFLRLISFLNTRD